MAHTCVVCGVRAYSSRCFRHKAKKPLQSLRKPRRQSAKELEYQVWKETVARPFIIERDENKCQCCGQYARFGEKLDIDHVVGKGADASGKRDVDNMQLLCRFPCHRRKTDRLECTHAESDTDTRSGEAF